MQYFKERKIMQRGCYKNNTAQFTNEYILSELVGTNKILNYLNMLIYNYLEGVK